MEVQLQVFDVVDNLICRSAVCFEFADHQDSKFELPGCMLPVNAVFFPLLKFSRKPASVRFSGHVRCCL